jgi:diaminohydroxyphosphoribosylaminopyrimidine deaminase / 5-amino-6-(5-phosphoribosylamino)uracil reductase
VNVTNEDIKWMKFALDEARKGIGKTAPNPPVGAVIVKYGKLLGKGWHQRVGEPHAERESIADATKNFGIDEIRGSTIYITLEPCSTHGRTPPCVQGIIDTGIIRVVYACDDMNPQHLGRAKKILNDAGIEVVSGVCEAEVQKILRPFFKVQHTGLPWVIIKIAMSLDGKITRPLYEGQWLSNELSRQDVQLLRSEIDMILTTGETVRKDLPRLTIRDPNLLEGRSQPFRVVMSRNEVSLPKDAPLFTDEWKDKTFVNNGDVSEVLKEFVREKGVLSVMVEAGSKFCNDLLKEGLVDEIICYIAPMIIGDAGVSIEGNGWQGIQLTQTEWAQLGNDVKYCGLVNLKK